MPGYCRASHAAVTPAADLARSAHVSSVGAHRSSPSATWQNAASTIRHSPRSVTAASAASRARWQSAFSRVQNPATGLAAELAQ